MPTDSERMLAAAIIGDENLHALIQLPPEESGVTDRARDLLASDPRKGTVRRYRMVSDNSSHTEDLPFLEAWVAYEDSEFGALYVTEPSGEETLVHRKPDSRMGFTPWAKEALLYPSGHVRDTKRRVFIMGGKDADNHRVRHELKVTVLVAWLDYAANPQYTRLWVKWKDGTRKLVHRKGL